MTDREKDLEEIPSEVKDKLTIHLAEDISQVLDWALIKRSEAE